MTAMPKPAVLVVDEEPDLCEVLSITLQRMNLNPSTANTVAGGGSLLSFPLLVALGLPPLDANVTNTAGIVPAALGGILGYRRELRGQGSRLLGMLPVSIAGA